MKLSIFLKKSIAIFYEIRYYIKVSYLMRGDSEVAKRGGL